MRHMPLLSLIVFTPLLGAIVLMLMRADQHAALRRGAFLFSLVPFGFSILLLARFTPTEAVFQFTEKAAWIPSFAINYALGVDGISLFLVLLTTFLMPIVVLSGWGDIHKRVKEYMVFLLLMETGMLGALVATDLFLFYVFWEVMLIPMYFLIGIWGGQRHIYAAIKLVLYTMAGSLLMLVAIVYLAVAHQQQFGQYSFDLQRLLEFTLPVTTQRWLFAAFALAFAIKVPMFPLHTWLPDAHTEAPTGGSVILAGVLLKMGTYGFLRFAIPLFPQAAFEAMPLIATLAIIGIVYGALVCMVQPDLKRLVAYSSVSHLGFVMLGLAALNTQGVQGSLYQMLNHGLSTGGLFLAVGVIYERRHTRLIKEFGGLWAQLPVYAAIFMVVMLSSVGLPGLNGFVGEFLILIGAFKAYPTGTAIASSGVILGAVYLLWMYQRVMFGPLDNPENQKLKDLSTREILVFVPLIIMFFVMGIYPKPFLSRMEPSVQATLARLEKKLAETGSSNQVAQR
ncbi:MAG: NADH-quinone oxidoreductase subunit M [Deltaproteobacteria bacterium]|nr:NADH-quinone oxidoreductase subunit M [Deltaproteobacteria bacterium]